MKLKQRGSSNGDKGFQGDIPNLKFGEFRYYTQDNPNLYRAQKRYHLTRKAFERLLHRCFEGYSIARKDSNDYIGSDNQEYYVGAIYSPVIEGESEYMYPIVINKGYICFKEATPTEDGTILNIHNGYVLVFKERYKGSST